MTFEIDLHIFTNATKHAPNTKTIESTYSSFVDTFGTPTDVNIWYDPKPNTFSADEYKTNLSKIFTNVQLTTCFADGYVKAIKKSKSNFMFMLEHDWIFLKKNIHHTYQNICKTMEEKSIYHLRFNKRETTAKGWDSKLQENNSNNMYYCHTPAISNNPHIIQRDLYIKKALPYINTPKNGERGGVEQNLTAASDLQGAIYGPKNHPSTVKHLDGSNRRGNKNPWI